MRYRAINITSQFIIPANRYKYLTEITQFDGTIYQQKKSFLYFAYNQFSYHNIQMFTPKIINNFRNEI